MPEWTIENTGWTRLETGPDLMDLLDGTYTRDTIEVISKLRQLFGKDFEKLYELDNQYNGKAYTKQVVTGKCRCGSCDDIFELHICINR